MSAFDSQPPKKNSEEKFIDVDEVNQHRWLKESGLWLENVDRNHLVLASGKPLLQKVSVYFYAFLAQHFSSFSTLLKIYLYN